MKRGALELSDLFSPEELEDADLDAIQEEFEARAIRFNEAFESDFRDRVRGWSL